MHRSRVAEDRTIVDVLRGQLSQSSDALQDHAAVGPGELVVLMRLAHCPVSSILLGF